MGCGSSEPFVYTVADVEFDMAQLAPRLPVAELMTGGIIKLEGANGFFNPNSLLDPSWLKGKMTTQEFAQAIDYINRCTAHSHVGLSKVSTRFERPMRLKLRTDAGMAAVEQINQRFRSVRFTYQATAEDIMINTSYDTTVTGGYGNRGLAAAVHATKVLLYIATNE